MLLRVGRRKTSFEEQDPEVIVSIEFRTSSGEPDLRPSVYRIAQSAVVQTHAEHQAGCMLSPTPVANFDLTDDSVIFQRAPGNDAFAFTRECHHELLFEDSRQLLSFVAAILAEGRSRRIPSTKPQMASYVHGRVAAADHEWLSFLERAQGSKKNEWEKLIAGAPAE